MKKNRTLLLVMPRGSEREELIEKLGGDYLLLLASGPEDSLALLEEKRFSISVVLLDLRLARADGYALGERLLRQEAYARLPLIGVSPDASEREALDCLRHGCLDVILPDTPRELLLRRIDNVIRAEDSISFHDMERMLRELPSNIFLKDAQGRYVFSTHFWHHLIGQEGEASVRGKTDLELRKDKENARKAMESDRRILETGQGMDYVIEEKSDGMVEYLRLTKRPVFDEQGRPNGIIAIVSDVTEQELLRRELEKRAQIDHLTELLNKNTTEEIITMRLSDCRRRHLTGTLMMIDVDNFKAVNDSCGHTVGDMVLAQIGRVFRCSFRGTDVAGRVGGDEFMLFLPGLCGEEPTAALAQRIEEQVAQTFEGSRVEGRITLSIGAASYPVHGRDFAALYKAADAALYEVKNNGKAGFRLYDGPGM